MQMQNPSSLNQLNELVTHGDDPLEYMEDDDQQEVGISQQYTSIRQKTPVQNRFEKENVQEYPSEQHMSGPSYYQRTQTQPVNSLSQLMGKSRPKDFAQQYVFGGQKKIISDLQRKQQLQYERDSQFYNSTGFQHRSVDLLSRFASPQHRDFGNEINMNGMESGVQSDMTKFSIQLKKNFRQQSVDRFSQGQSKTGLLLPEQTQTQKAQLPLNYNQDRQKQHFTKLSSEHCLIQEKKKQLKDRLEQEELAKCTFTPIINRKPNERMDKLRFYDTMETKKIELMKKNDQLKEELDNKITKTIKDKPDISQRTKKLADRKLRKSGTESVSVVDRLFHGKNGNMQTEEDNFQPKNTIPVDPECTFKPQISWASHQLAFNKQRFGTVDAILYNDAKKRQQKHKQQQMSMDGQFPTQYTLGSQQLKEVKSTFNQAHQNKVTVQANIDRFRKEMETAFYAIVRGNDKQIENKMAFLGHKLSYYEMVEMMKVMYFLYPSPTEDWTSSHSNSSVALAQKVWNQLYGKQNNYVISRNLLVFLYAVLNIHVTKDIVEMINDPKGDYKSEQQYEQQPNRNVYNQEEEIASERLSHTDHEYNNFYGDYNPSQSQNTQQRAESQLSASVQSQQNKIPSQQQIPQNIDIQNQPLPSNTQKQQPTQQQRNGQELNKKMASELKPDERPQTHFSGVHRFDSDDNIAIDNSPYQYQMYNSQIPQSENEKIFCEKLEKIRNIPRHIGYYDSQGNLHITEENTLQIHNWYHMLFLNKLSGSKGTTHYRKLTKQTELLPEESSFKPKINEISKQIAQNKRQRIIEHMSQQNNRVAQIDLHDILCYQKTLGDEQKKLMKEEQENEELEGCTFQPKTKNYHNVSQIYKKSASQFSNQILETRKNYATSPNPSGVDRTEELYRLAKPHNQKRDRLKQEVEYEKECDECTFQPDINTSKKIGSGHQSFMFMSQNQNPNNQMVSQGSTAIRSATKAEMKTIERVQRARIQKEMKDHMIKTGNTSNLNQDNQLQYNLHQQEMIKHKPQKMKRKAETQSYNSVSQNRSPNSSIFQKSPMSNQGFQGYSSPYYNEGYRVDTNGSQEDSTPQQAPSQPKTNNYMENRNQNNKNPSGNNYSNYNNTGASPQVPFSANQQKTAEDDKVPLLFVDVNIEEGKAARIIVYEGDSSEELATRFTQEHGLDPSMKHKLKDLLDQQINSLLTKIDEEIISDSSSCRND